MLLFIFVFVPRWSECQTDTRGPRADALNKRRQHHIVTRSTVGQGVCGLEAPSLVLLAPEPVRALRLLAYLGVPAAVMRRT